MEGGLKDNHDAQIEAVVKRAKRDLKEQTACLLLDVMCITVSACAITSVGMEKVS